MPKDQSLYLQWKLNERFSKMVKLLFFSSQCITFKSYIGLQDFISSYKAMKRLKQKHRRGYFMCHMDYIQYMYVLVLILIYIVGVAQTNRLWRHDALSLKSTSCWSYRGRNRIINPHLCSISKQIKLQTNSYSECAPQDVWLYYWMLEIERQNARFKQFIVQVS